MLAAKGAALALGAALVNTVIDGLRKMGSRELSSSSLVCLVALLDALISCVLVWASGACANGRWWGTLVRGADRACRSSIWGPERASAAPSHPTPHE